MISKRAQVFILMAAIVYSADASSILRKKRELPLIWKNIKTLPKEEIASSVKAIFDPSRKNALDEKITEEINTFLVHPDVDPMLIPHMDVNVTQGLVKLNGTLDTITATGLSKLKVVKVHVNVLLLKAEFEFALPSVAVRGNYNMDCLVDGVLPVFGKGPFEVTLTNAKAKGTIKVGLKNGSVYIKSLDLDLNLGGLHVNIQHLMEDEEISAAFNKMINDMALGLLADNKEVIEKIVAERLVTFVNSKMAGISLKAVLDAVKAGVIADAADADFEAMTTAPTATEPTTATPEAMMTEAMTDSTMGVD